MEKPVKFAFREVKYNDVPSREMGMTQSNQGKRLIKSATVFCANCGSRFYKDDFGIIGRSIFDVVCPEPGCGASDKVTGSEIASQPK